MELSIVIVSWNTREALRSCLRSIEQRKGGLKVQTIVVDNDSRDGTGEMVAAMFPSVTLIRSGGNLGFARGCNLGLRRAESPLVLFLNPDTEVTGDALADMVGFIEEHQDVAALNCLFREPGGDAFGPGLQWFPSPLTELAILLLVSKGTAGRLARILPYHPPELSGYVRKLYGGCLLVRRAVLEQVGPFDERFFMYCEDVDLSRRMLQAGWKLYYLAEAEIRHLGGGASSGAPSDFSVLMMCESFSKLMRKYYGVTGSAGYRVVALGGSLFRLTILGGLRLASLLRRDKAADQRLSSLRKYAATVQWALGWRRAFIPPPPPGTQPSGQSAAPETALRGSRPSAAGVDLA